VFLLGNSRLCSECCRSDSHRSRNIGQRRRQRRPHLPSRTNSARDDTGHPPRNNHSHKNRRCRRTGRLRTAVPPHRRDSGRIGIGPRRSYPPLTRRQRLLRIRLLSSSHSGKTPRCKRNCLPRIAVPRHTVEYHHIGIGHFGIDPRWNHKRNRRRRAYRIARWTVRRRTYCWPRSNHRNWRHRRRAGTPQGIGQYCLMPAARRRQSQWHLQRNRSIESCRQARSKLRGPQRLSGHFHIAGCRRRLRPLKTSPRRLPLHLSHLRGVDPRGSPRRPGTRRSRRCSPTDRLLPIGLAALARLRTAAPTKLFRDRLSLARRA
jgi:hypothetical protein